MRIAYPLLRDAALTAIERWAARQLDAAGDAPSPPAGDWSRDPVAIGPADDMLEERSVAAPHGAADPSGRRQVRQAEEGTPADDPGAADGLCRRIARQDNLALAWKAVSSRKPGSPGIDGQTIRAFGENLPQELRALSTELTHATYRPCPLRCVQRRKQGGGRRQLAIPAVRDRVAQRAMAQILELLVDPELTRWSFAYRGGQGCHEAISEVDALLAAGRTWILRADVKDCFDTIPHQPLLARLAAIVDGEEALLETVRRVIASPRLRGRSMQFPKLGVPQGSPLSPLLANLYLDPVDRALRGSGFRYLRYADDILVACESQGQARQAGNLLASEIAGVRLQLNDEKSRIIDSAAEPFEFLGHACQRRVWTPAPGRIDALLAELERKLQAAGRHGAKGAAEASRMLEGWIAYYGKRTDVADSLRKKLARMAARIR